MVRITGGQFYITMFRLRFLLVALAAANCLAEEPKCEAIEKEDHFDVECSSIDNFFRIITTLAKSEKQLNKLQISNSPQLISYFKREYFDKHPALAQLAKLDLSENSMTHFNPEPFQGLSLDYLILQGNNFSTIPADMFSGLQSVTFLNLNDNHIEYIDANVFKQFRNLTSLYLKNNCLSTITPGLFDGLGLLHLDLGYNSLSTIDNTSFEGLTHLTHLNLGQNDIATIQSAAFQNLLSLNFLRLDDNELASLDQGLFEDNPLIDLNLQGNKIDNLDNFPINSSSLKALRLTGCNITTIPVDYFRNVPNLLLINLDENRINAIEPGVFTSLPNLVVLSLNNNSLTSLNISSFSQFYPIFKLPQTVDMCQLGQIVNGTLFERPTVKLSPNPWDCSADDMVELRAWCEEYVIAFDEIFDCKAVLPIMG